MTGLPVTVPLLAGQPTVAVLDGYADAHSILILRSTLATLWVSRTASTPTAWGDDMLTNWFTPDDPTASGRLLVELPESGQLRLLSATDTSVRVELLPPAVETIDMDSGYSLGARQRYPTIGSGVTSIDISAIASAGTWLRVDLPTTPTAWATVDGTTPAQGTGVITNAYGRCSHPVVVPVSGNPLKVWTDMDSGTTTRMRISCILPPSNKRLAATG